MRIWVDPARLQSYQLSMGDLSDAITRQNAQIAPGRVGGAPTVTANSTFTSGIQFIKTGIIATDEILGEVQDAINDDGLSVTGYGTVTVYVQEKPTAEINARWQITT